MLLAGTADGLFDVGLDGTVERRALSGAAVLSVSGDWAVADNRVMALDAGTAVELPDGLRPRCVVAIDGGRALVGTNDARIVEVGGPGGPARDERFDALPGRTAWSTPWGGPPDTRSLAAGPSGAYAGVHVGGVWRREPEGWVEVVAAGADDHQVVCAGDLVAVAGAIGVGQSDDGGRTWQWSDHGLHARYCRAVAVAEGWLLASASTGPVTADAGVYRRPLGDPQAPFARCGSGRGTAERRTGGLPRTFAHNVDTFHLAAAGPLVAVGTPGGALHVSEDSGATWRTVTTTLPGVRCVEFSV